MENWDGSGSGFFRGSDPDLNPIFSPIRIKIRIRVKPTRIRTPGLKGFLYIYIYEDLFSKLIFMIWSLTCLTALSVESTKNISFVLTF